MEGYKHMFNETLVTVWSAPNYCYRYVSKTYPFECSSLSLQPADLLLAVALSLFATQLWKRGGYP
jgi:hypothetical protein